MVKRKNVSQIAKYLNVSGNILIVFSILFIYLTFAPALGQEIKYFINESFGIIYSIDSPSKDKFILSRNKTLSPPNESFSVVIPKIGAAAPVVEKVDPYNKGAYLSSLKMGVAHAKGTSLPGDEGNVYLFAHSTDTFYNVGAYNAVFYLLGKMEAGDEIFIYYEGEKLKYIVSDVKVTGANSIKYLGKLKEGKTLTLQTCYPPGTTLKRLVVVADKVE